VALMKGASRGCARHAKAQLSLFTVYGDHSAPDQIPGRGRSRAGHHQNNEKEDAPLPHNIALSRNIDAMDSMMKPKGGHLFQAPTVHPLFITTVRPFQDALSISFFYR
jgi:hypothetical protein